MMMRRTFTSPPFAVVCAAAALSVSISAQAPSPSAARPCPGCGIAPEPIDDTDVTGWTKLFDGATLDGWDGNPDVWKVENGALSAESTPTRRLGTTYLIWRGGEPADFELKVEIKAESDIHGGVFYRGSVGAGPARAQAATLAVPANPKWNVTGYSLDFDYGPDNDGNVQDTGGRPETQIVWRGHIVRMEPGKRPRSIGSLGDRDALMKAIKPGEWNQLHIIAQGPQVTHIVNGQVMAILVDDDAAARKTKGVIALQIEQYGTGRINFRNLWLKQRN
jgi:hypothetical protein